MCLRVEKKASIKYRMINDHSQELILFFDHTGTIVDCNTTALNELGYGEKIFRTNITDIFRKAMKAGKNEPDINTKYIGKTAEAIAYRKNQTCFAVNLKVVINRGLKTYLGICTASNIEEEKKAFHELKHMKNEIKTFDEIKNEFIANITHELRTPVNGILGLTEELLDTELTAKQLDTLNIIHRCCMNMNTIINDILDFTKIANKKMILENREFDFRGFIDGVIALNVNKIYQKGLKLIINIAEDIPKRVIGDECRLSQILNNLFSNAIKFTSVGQIALEVVKTAQTEKHVELFFVVMDTGIGISNEEKDKLFLSFTQVDGSISRRFGGTGLGLSICKMLVESMHGSIAVDSEKGKGSTFSFSVRLRLAKSSEEEKVLERGPYCVNMGYIRSKSLQSNRREKDYIELMLEKANHFYQSDHSMDQNGAALEVKEDNAAQLDNLLEKLMLCIEMDTWDKAEEIAMQVRVLISEEDKEMKNKSLSLLLSIRKEEHDNSLALLNEIEQMIMR